MVWKLWVQPGLACLCMLMVTGCGGPSKKGASAFVTESKELMESGAFREAEQLLEPLSVDRKDKADGPELMFLLARCEEQQGKLDEAERTLYRCLVAGQSGPVDVMNAHAGLARIARTGGRHFSADRHLNQALKAGITSRNKDSIRVLMVEAALSQGKHADAKRQFAAIVDRDSAAIKSLARRLGLSAKAAPIVPTPKVTSGPRILKRSRWRARPINPGGNPSRLGRPFRITIHHGAEKVAAPTSMTGAAQRVRSYQSAHQVSNGWADIGYHFVVDASGRIWEGRELKWQGAHAGSPAANKGNIGICLMGNFDVVAPNYAQKTGLERLLNHLTHEYQISWSKVDGHNTVLRHHHRSRGTRCPGRLLQSWLDRLKTRHLS